MTGRSLRQLPLGSGGLGHRARHTLKYYVGHPRHPAHHAQEPGCDLEHRKASFFKLAFGLLTLLVGLLAFWSVSPATIRPFVLHCFLVGRRREEAFPVFVRCRGREAFPEQGPACRKDKPPGKVPAGLLPQSLTAGNKDL